MLGPVQQAGCKPQCLFSCAVYALVLALRSMTFSQVKSETGSRPKWPYAAVFLYLGRLRSRLRAISPARKPYHMFTIAMLCCVSPPSPAAASSNTGSTYTGLCRAQIEGVSQPQHQVANAAADDCGIIEEKKSPGRKSKFLRTAWRISLSGMVPVP